MTLFASSSNARTFDYQAGDVGFVPASSGTLSESTLQGTCKRILTFVVDLGHYVENIGNTTLHFLEIFNTGESLNRLYSISHPVLNRRCRPFPGY